MSNEQKIFRVNLREFGGKVYVGRPKGELGRTKFRLSEAEASNDVIVVVVPLDTFAINSSFLLGLVGPAIKASGSREAFLEKYRFEATEAQRSDFLDEAIDEAIGHVLIPDAPLLGRRK